VVSQQAGLVSNDDWKRVYTMKEKPPAGDFLEPDVYSAQSGPKKDELTLYPEPYGINRLEYLNGERYGDFKGVNAVEEDTLFDNAAYLSQMKKLGFFEEKNGGFPVATDKGEYLASIGAIDLSGRVIDADLLEKNTSKVKIELQLSSEVTWWKGLSAYKVDEHGNKGDWIPEKSVSVQDKNKSASLELDETDLAVVRAI